MSGDLETSRKKEQLSANSTAESNPVQPGVVGVGLEDADESYKQFEAMMVLTDTVADLLVKPCAKSHMIKPRVVGFGHQDAEDDYKEFLARMILASTVGAQYAELEWTDPVALRRAYCKTFSVPSLYYK